MRYKLLGKSGLRVSELCLGTMTFGEDWGWGASKAVSREIFDLFAAAGGNFIDTSNNYTNGTSERFVGEFIANERERFVVATKYALNTRKDDPNAGGNQRKNMVQALNASLKRLNVEYVDLLWLHMWDYMTPVEEVMRALDDVVRAGKVLYIGMSDTPAWVQAQANTLAELRGWSRLVATQVAYSLAARDIEREIMPMAKAHDLAVAAWDILDGGALTGKYNTPSDEPKRSSGASPRVLAIAAELIKMGQEIGRTPAQIAINWVRQQQAKALVIPIVGARSAAQMRDNLACLEFELTPQQVQQLDALNPLELGFPAAFLASPHVKNLIFGDTYPLIDSHRG
ncbi:MAG: aldo/keto reductase [Chloroflexi bacterium]|nr:aldo/keto reductase [Chloroflexota bacterium]